MRLDVRIAVLSIILIVALCWSLMVGAVPLRVEIVLNTLFELDGPRQNFIIMQSRLPRSLLAALTGGALALSGAIVQTILCNDLASPKIIGINSGAALGVITASLLLPTLPSNYLSLAAASGAALAAGLVFLLFELRAVSPTRLILIGVALGLFFEAIVNFLLIILPNTSVSGPLIWLSGSLWGLGWSNLTMIWLPLTVLFAVTGLLSYRLDLLRLGRAQAVSLGVHVRRERLALLTLATLLAALSVSAVGVMGFVGLMAPHLARALVGWRHQLLLPTAALTGAILVTFADTVGRIIAPPIEVSAGILTAFIGAPFFIVILLRNRREVQP